MRARWNPDAGIHVGHRSAQPDPAAAARTYHRVTSHWTRIDADGGRPLNLLPAPAGGAAVAGAAFGTARAGRVLGQAATRGGTIAIGIAAIYETVAVVVFAVSA